MSQLLACYARSVVVAVLSVGVFPPYLVASVQQLVLDECRLVVDEMFLVESHTLGPLFFSTTGVEERVVKTVLADGSLGTVFGSLPIRAVPILLTTVAFLLVPRVGILGPFVLAPTSFGLGFAAALTLILGFGL